MKIWNEVIKTAHKIRGMLETLNLQSFVKVTGGKGLHIHVPVQPKLEWDQVKHFCKSLMQVLEQQAPAEYTTNMNKVKRKGRIFLDYLRNGYGATAVAPYSLRARPHPVVAFPIEWKDVKKSLKPDQFDMKKVLKILDKRENPWSGYWDLNQTILLSNFPA